MENRGIPINEKKIVYKTLYSAMLAAGWRPCAVAREMGVAPNTILRKLKGTHEWFLWECIEIKRIIGSEMPIEALFVRDLTNL